jgi:hypothetical protein
MYSKAIKDKELVDMKKWAISIFTAALVIGTGTAVFAQGDGEGFLHFEKMKPFMEKVHPDFSEQQLKDMFDSCHGENGLMKNTNFNEMHNLDMKNNSL